MHRLQTVIGGALALALCAISVGCCFLFGTHLAQGVEGTVYGTLGAVADAMKALLPLSIGAALAARHRMKAIIGTVLFITFTLYSFCSELGLYALSRDAQSSSASAGKEAYQSLKDERARIAKRLSELGSARPSRAIEAEIAGQKQDRWWTLSDSCKNAAYAAARTFCAGVERLEAERATAIEAESLRTQDNQFAAKMSGYDLREVLKSADAQSEALGRLLGIDPSRVKDGLAIMVAVLIELGSGFGLFAISGHGAAAGAGTASPAGQSQAPVEPAASGQRRKPGKAKQDPVASFCRAMLLAKDGAETTAAEVYLGWQAWVATNGGPVLSPTALGRRLSEMGYQRTKRGGIARYTGIDLREMKDGAEAPPSRLKIVKA